MTRLVVALAVQSMLAGAAPARQDAPSPRPGPTAEPMAEPRPTPPPPTSASFPRKAKLSSGKEIDVLGMGLINFREAPPGLALSYRTTISIDDLADWTLAGPEWGLAALGVSVVAAGSVLAMRKPRPEQAQDETSREEAPIA